MEECAPLLFGVVARVGEVLQVGRLDDAEHVGAWVLPALHTAPGRAAVDQAGGSLRTSTRPTLNRRNT